MVADADGEALPRSGKYGERAIVYLQEFTGMFEEGRALRRKLHVSLRAGKPEAPTGRRSSTAFTARCTKRSTCP
jgi:hypothetical protein